MWKSAQKAKKKGKKKSKRNKKSRVNVNAANPKIDPQNIPKINPKEVEEDSFLSTNAGSLEIDQKIEEEKPHTSTDAGQTSPQNTDSFPDANPLFSLPKESFFTAQKPIPHNEEFFKKLLDGGPYPLYSDHIQPESDGAIVHFIMAGRSEGTYFSEEDIQNTDFSDFPGCFVITIQNYPPKYIKKADIGTILKSSKPDKFPSPLIHNQNPFPNRNPQEFMDTYVRIVRYSNRGFPYDNPSSWEEHFRKSKNHLSILTPQNISTTVEQDIVHFLRTRPTNEEEWPLILSIILTCHSTSQCFNFGSKQPSPNDQASVLSKGDQSSTEVLQGCQEKPNDFSFTLWPSPGIINADNVVVLVPKYDPRYYNLDGSEVDQENPDKYNPLVPNYHQNFGNPDENSVPENCGTEIQFVNSPGNPPKVSEDEAGSDSRISIKRQLQTTPENPDLLKEKQGTEEIHLAQTPVFSFSSPALPNMGNNQTQLGNSQIEREKLIASHPEVEQVTNPSENAQAHTLDDPQFLVHSLPSTSPNSDISSHMSPSSQTQGEGADPIVCQELMKTLLDSSKADIHQQFTQITKTFPQEIQNIIQQSLPHFESILQEKLEQTIRTLTVNLLTHQRLQSSLDKKSMDQLKQQLQTHSVSIFGNLTHGFSQVKNKQDQHSADLHRIHLAIRSLIRKSEFIDAHIAETFNSLKEDYHQAMNQITKETSDLAMRQIQRFEILLATQSQQMQALFQEVRQILEMITTLTAQQVFPHPIAPPGIDLQSLRAVLFQDFTELLEGKLIKYQQDISVMIMDQVIKSLGISQIQNSPISSTPPMIQSPSNPQNNTSNSPERPQISGEEIREEQHEILTPAIEKFMQSQTHIQTQIQQIQTLLSQFQSLSPTTNTPPKEIPSNWVDSHESELYEENQSENTSQQEPHHSSPNTQLEFRPPRTSSPSEVTDQSSLNTTIVYNDSQESNQTPSTLPVPNVAEEPPKTEPETSIPASPPPPYQGTPGNSTQYLTAEQYQAQVAKAASGKVYSTYPVFPHHFGSLLDLHSPEEVPNPPQGNHEFQGNQNSSNSQTHPKERETPTVEQLLGSFIGDKDRERDQRDAEIENKRRELALREQEAATERLRLEQTFALKQAKERRKAQESAQRIQERNQMNASMNAGNAFANTRGTTATLDLKDLPTFNGNPPEDIIDFFAALEKFSLRMQWDDAATLAQLQTLLTSSAYATFQALFRPNTTYQEIKTQLLNHYITAEFKHDKFTDLKLCKQKPNQNLNEYYAEFTRLAKVILHNYNENDPLPDPTNPPLASHTPMVFAEGLYNPDLKFHVKRMEPRSVDHAFHLAMREARVLELDQTPGQSGTKPISSSQQQSNFVPTPINPSLPQTPPNYFSQNPMAPMTPFYSLGVSTSISNPPPEPH